MMPQGEAPRATDTVPTMLQATAEPGNAAKAIWRHRWVVLSCVTLFASVALLSFAILDLRYTAEAAVLLEARKTKVVNVEDVLTTLPADSETLESEVHIIRSRDLAKRIVVHLRLDADPAFNPLLRPPGPLERLQATLADELKLVSDWLQRRNERDAEPLVKTVDEFLKRLRVSPEPRSRVIRVAFTAPTAEKAAVVANTIADFYLTNQLEAKFEATERANKWINERLTELRERVRVSEEAVEKFRREADLTRGREVTPSAQQLSELSTQLVAARASRTEAEAQLSQVERLLSTGNIDRLNDVLRSQLIQQLRAQEAEVSRRVAEVSETFGEKHPRIQRALAELADVRGKIRSETERIVTALRNSVLVAREREAAVLASLSAFRAETAKENTAEVRLRALEREASANRNLLETFLARSKETTQETGFQTADARIISRADVPDAPSFPRKALILAAMSVTGLLGGIVLALALDRFDGGFRSTEQIEPRLGIRGLTIVPMVGGVLERPEMVAVRKPTSGFSESLRILLSGVLGTRQDGMPKVILIASALPGEGKSTLAASLARVLALAGRRVVVVDCDLRRGVLHQHFRAPANPGLTELLDGSTQLSEVLHTDWATPAAIVPAGRPVTDPMDRLASSGMRIVLNLLADRFDLVIMDSAPLLLVADTRALAPLADKVILAVRWRKTRRETAALATRALLEAGADIAGAALTLVDARRHARWGFGDSGLYHGRAKRYYAS